ncbi:MAG: DAK2 domain-containing protein [Clostridia bacterium]|nr:DAK2 domain-containing protein [Clostridia bacterium]
MQKTINGATFRRMVNAANIFLETSKKYIDSLNVFPVQDGDTGANMSATFKSAAKYINECPTNNFDALGDALGKGSMRGARGNSGVILSQIMRGMSIEMVKHQELTTKNWAKAMKCGAEYAYKAVSIPKEGTILTVIRVMAESAEAAAKKYQDFEGFFDQVIKTGEEILEETPEMLPVLKQAGVVDAGGRGVLDIFKGFYKGMLNEDEEFILKEAEESRPIVEDNLAIINYENLADIEFAYCTEYMIIQLNKKTTISDIDRLREKLMAIGDSVICVGDLELIKVHVHTNEPNRALGYALELGELYNLKIENMVQQNRELKAAREKVIQNTKPFGMVAVASGEGIVEVFKDLGVDQIVEGGQTMNPSANDIAEAVDKVPSDHVFIFPNNKNIIMAAEQAQNFTKRFIHVIPTISIPEGVASMLSFNMDSSLDDNLEAMTAARKSIKSGSITNAVRTANMDGLDIQEGDIIGLFDGAIKVKDALINNSAEKLVEAMMDEDKVNITLFYGKDVKEEDANELCEKLQEKYPNCDVSVINGGQPVYFYLISVE